MQFILEHISDIFAFGCISAIAIEKNSYIKFKPLTWLGNQVNSDMKKEIENTNNKIDKIQKQVDGIEYKNAMKDLADVRNRLISYGLLMQKGEELDCDVQHIGSLMRIRYQDKTLIMVNIYLDGQWLHQIQY